MSFISGKKYNPVSPEEAVSIVKSGDKVFMHTAAATPQVLSKALSERWEELKNVKIYHMHVEGDAPYADEKYADSFRVNNMFVGKNTQLAGKSFTFFLNVGGAGHGQTKATFRTHG